MQIEFGSSFSRYPGLWLMFIGIALLASFWGWFLTKDDRKPKKASH